LRESSAAAASHEIHRALFAVSGAAIDGIMA
jgi:hypothetical protein